MSKEQAASDLYKYLQTQFQVAYVTIVDNAEELAIEAEASVIDIAFCLGSSIASLVFEMSRAHDQTHGLTEHQEKLMNASLSYAVEAFNEKVAILRNKDQLSEIVVDLSIAKGSNAVN